jgi:SGNH domain (fused to AT3 domains)
MAAENEIVDDDAGVVICDPAAILLDLRTCNAFDGRLPLFFDGDHLTKAFAQPLSRKSVDERAGVPPVQGWRAVQIGIGQHHNPGQHIASSQHDGLGHRRRRLYR